jgi:glutaconate CoA-transferase subunit A
MRSLLGTDLPRVNPALRPAADPFSGAPVILVPAIVPDVAILHVQRADEEGHAHVWGTLGVTREAALAARRVVLVAEEILPRDQILNDPGLVLVPALKVAAVVHQPYGAYPSPVQGHYGRHHDCYRRYHDESRTEEGMRDWLTRWVLDVDDWPGFLARVGAETLEAIRVKCARPSRPLDYGA